MDAVHRIEPASEADISAVVESARGRTRLRVEGNGSLSDWGPIEDGAQRLSTCRLVGTVFYEPEELVLAVRPGTTVAEIASTLRQSGQALAFEPPDLAPLWGRPAERCTIGGTVAANLAGPRRWKAGAPRDHLLGLRAVNGQGQVFRAGSRVMKNVTGFDLPKLFCGSFGSLGVLTEVTLKVLPRPEHERTLVAAGWSVDAGCAALREAVASPFEPSGAAFLPETAARAAGLSGAAAVLRFEGTALSIRWRVAALRRAIPAWSGAEELDDFASSSMWTTVRDASVFVGDNRALWRLSVAPLSGPDVVKEIGGAIASTHLLDWVGGLVWVRIDQPAEDAGAALIDRVVARVGGHATLLRGPASLRGRLARNTNPGVAALARDVMRAFDPDGVFAAGSLPAA